MRFNRLGGGRQATEEAKPESAGGGCYVITSVVALLTLACGQGRPP